MGVWGKVSLYVRRGLCGQDGWRTWAEEQRGGPGIESWQEDAFIFMSLVTVANLISSNKLER